MGTKVKGGKGNPAIEIAAHFLMAGALYDVIEESCMGIAQSAPLERQPTVKCRAALNRKAVKKIADKKVGQGSQLFRCKRPKAVSMGCGNLDRIDRAIRQIEGDRIALGTDALLTDQRPDLAQTPSQFTARIVGNIPQKVAKLSPSRGMRRKRQIGKKSTHLARSGQRHVHAFTANCQWSEQSER
ncbi:hypothetical protein D3C71_1695660 [compost metagenome]